MASAPNTKASLETAFKFVVKNSVNNLLSPVAIVQKLIPELSEAERTGRGFKWSTVLTHEQGISYGDGTAFAYEDDIAAVYDEIELDSNPCVLKSRVSMAAANRMENNKQSLVSRMTLQSGTMKESLTKRAEISCLYGKTGLGIVESQSGSSTTRTYVFTAASWAPGIWSGLEGCILEGRLGATKRNTDADVFLTSVDFDARSILVSGDATDLDAIVTGDSFFFKGSYTNDFYGIDAQLTNTGTLFGISASTYQLWKANAQAVTGRLTMGKVLKGVAKAVGKGGLGEDCVLLVSPTTFENLNEDFSALRATDSSYKQEEGVNGVSGITFYCQAGKVKIVSHSMVKEGESFLIPVKSMKRVGAKEMTFNMADGEYFERLENYAGYQIVMQYDWCILIEKPAKCVKYTGIVNS